jgi:hypothetical protein
MYLFTRAIEQNHEFEVDSLLTENRNKQNYAGLLLHLSVNARELVYNNFAKTPLQQRITMLFNARSSKGKQLVYLLILPLLSLSFIAFANMKRIYTPKMLNKPAAVFSKPADEVTTKTPQAEEPKPEVANATEQTSSTAAQPVIVDTTTRYSVISGVEKLGKAPLVLIDGKEYPSNILYEISSTCIRGTGIWMPDNAEKYFGPKAKDGCVKITTRDGKILEQTDIEKSNLKFEAFLNKETEGAKQKAIQQSTNWVLLGRGVLTRPDGSLYDKIVEVDSKGKTTIDVAHNAKVAYFIDSTFYTEADMKEVLPQKFYMLKGVSGVRNLDVKKMPDNNLHGYESVMYFWSSAAVVSKLRDPGDFNWEKHIPVN